MENTNSVSTLVVSDVFEISGVFVPATIEAFSALDARVGGNDEAREAVRPELEMVEDLCTNSEDSMSEAQLQRAVKFLIAKLDSIAK